VPEATITGFFSLNLPILIAKLVFILKSTDKIFCSADVLKQKVLPYDLLRVKYGAIFADHLVFVVRLPRAKSRGRSPAPSEVEGWFACPERSRGVVRFDFHWAA
jgi:hypothetical protein